MPPPRKCFGFFKRTVTVRNEDAHLVDHDAGLLLNDTLHGTDDGKPSWYSEQIVSFYKQDGTSVSLKGAYKHFNCDGFVLSDTDEATCFECSKIPNLKSFKKDRCQEKMPKG